MFSIWTFDLFELAALLCLMKILQMWNFTNCTGLHCSPPWCCWRACKACKMIRAVKKEISQKCSFIFSAAKAGDDSSLWSQDKVQLKYSSNTWSFMCSTKHLVFIDLICVSSRMRFWNSNCSSGSRWEPVESYHRCSSIRKICFLNF